MKRFFAICLLLAALFCVIGAPAGASAAPAAGWNTLDARLSVLGSDKLVSNADAVILYEVNSDTLVYDWNGDKQLYPSSMVKILTALIAVERGNLSDQVTVDEGVLKTVPYDAVTANLKPGEVLTLRDLLYCMMVGSANDAAAVIAAHIGGTQAAFVAEMNSYAQNLGCTGSHFTNAHGLHNKEQVSTARDIAKILAEAVKQETFMEVFCAPRYTVPATNLSDQRVFITGNYLISKEKEEIYYDSRVTGGRTGVTEDQKRCMAATAESNGMQIISVVMGAKSKYAADGYTIELYGGFSETSELLDKTFGGYRCAQVLFEGQVLRQSPVVGARNHVMLGSTSSLFAVLPLNVTSKDLTYHYTDSQEEFRVPVEKGDILSNVEVWYGGVQVAQTQLQAMNKVYGGSLEDTRKDYGADLSWIWIVLIVVVSCIFAAFLLRAVYRRINQQAQRAAARKRHRGYRRSRRRSR